MTITITSDASMPTCLNTPTKQTTKARKLAHSYLGIPAKKTQRPSPQGFFSRTVTVTLQTGAEIVIQFRLEPLDTEPFTLARSVLGHVVPSVTPIPDAELESAGVWTYALTRIAGTTWLEGARGRMAQTRVTTVRSLAQILSKGHIPSSSSEAVINNTIRPHLDLILQSEDPHIRGFREVAGSLMGTLDGIKKLPLFVAHFDLNDVNVMVNEDCSVSGIVDWELSTPLPFGMGFARIHTLAGEFTDGQFYMPPEFEEAEGGFWKEIWEGVGQDVRGSVEAEAVQMAVRLGTLLDAFQLEEGKIGPYNPVVVEALPMLLRYRIPWIRGEGEPAYEM